TRFGARLAYSIDVQPEAAGCEVPPLAVQTLVENSIKHAIAPRPGGGRLRVEASASGEHVLLSVWDDGPGFTGDAMRAGHGLDNLRARLAARFGAGASLEVGRRDGGFQVVERIPAGPMVVFTTAHDEHALRAFEVNALDYLLKPVERARLDRALDRIAARRGGPDDDVRETLGRLAQQLRAAPFLDHLAARTRDRVQLIAIGDITHVLARDRATYAVTAGAQHMLD